MSMRIVYVCHILGTPPEFCCLNESDFCQHNSECFHLQMKHKCHGLKGKGQHLKGENRESEKKSRIINFL